MAPAQTEPPPSYTPLSEGILADNPVCSIVQCIFSEDVCGSCSINTESCMQNEQLLQTAVIKAAANYELFSQLFILDGLFDLCNAEKKLPGPKVNSSKCLFLSHQQSAKI